MMGCARNSTNIFRLYTCLRFRGKGAQTTETSNSNDFCLNHELNRVTDFGNRLNHELNRIPVFINCLSHELSRFKFRGDKLESIQTEVESFTGLTVESADSVRNVKDKWISDLSAQQTPS